MKIVNDSIKNALKQPTTQRKGRILVEGNYYEVFNVEYYADAYNEGNVIGNAIASQLDFDLPYMPKFETFKYFDGVWTGTNYEYIDMGTFHVFDEQDEDDFNKHITAFDNLIKFNAPFQDVGGYPKKLFHELQNICNQAGVGLNNINIPNGNFEVVNNQFTNGESLKTVLKAICQLAGMYAIIKNDEVVLQLKNQTNEVINKEQHEPTIWKRRSYGINQVILGLSDVEGEYVIREDENDIEQNGVHKLVINDNPFAYTETKRDELIDELFDQVRGFGYIPYEVKGEWLNYLDIGDTIILDDVETIVLRINGKSPKALESMMSAPAIIDSSVEYVNNTNDVKNQLTRTERIVNKNNQTIIDVVEQTDEQNQKIAQVTQTVEELNSKIGDLADITTSLESNNGKLEFENINQSEPIRIVIRPNNESISYLYPSSGLYPSDTLYPKTRTLRFHNKTTGEDFDLILPDDVLYYDNENYDEFILDYDGLSCVINKKVGWNADGTTYVLDNPTTKEYEYTHLEITDGDYEITLLGYDNVYMFARLMAQNIYTTQFATKAELNSEITQTSQAINLSVDKKLENYSTTTEMNAQIQISANNIDQIVSQKVGKNEVVSSINNAINDGQGIIELTSNSVIINSDNFKLTQDGTIEAQNGTFNGKITTNSATITGGTIDLTTSLGNVTIGKGTTGLILMKAVSDGIEYESAYNVAGLTYKKGGNYRFRIGASSDSPYVYLYNGSNTRVARFCVSSNYGFISLCNASGTEKVSLSGSGHIQCVSLTQTSREENKKNFELYEDALKEIKKIDIYKYNFKDEEDGKKKHLGFVIGKKYNYSKQITSVDENGKEIGVDNYSMTSLCLQAIKELLEKVDTLENKIKELESDK